MKKIIRIIAVVHVLLLFSYLVIASPPDHCSICGSPDYHVTSTNEYHYASCQNPLCTIQEYCRRDDYICDDPECGKTFAHIHNILDTSHSDLNCPYQ